MVELADTQGLGPCALTSVRVRPPPSAPSCLAPPAFLAFAVKRALALNAEEPWRRHDLLQLSALARAKLAAVSTVVPLRTIFCMALR